MTLNEMYLHCSTQLEINLKNDIRPYSRQAHSLLSEKSSWFLLETSLAWIHRWLTRGYISRNDIFIGIIQMTKNIVLTFVCNILTSRISEVYEDKLKFQVRRGSFLSTLHFGILSFEHIQLCISSVEVFIWVKFLERD